MKLAVLVLLAGLVAGTSHAATLRVQATFPNQGDDRALCTDAPILTPAPSGVTATRLHYHWAGTLASGEDSVAAAPGVVGGIAKAVPSGAYTVDGWASWITPDGFYAAACPAQIVKIVGGKPATIIMGILDANPAWLGLVRRSAMLAVRQ